MKKIFFVALALLLIAFDGFGQEIRLLKVNTQTSPPTIRLKTDGPYTDLDRIIFKPLSDTNNTHMVKVFFKGCGVLQRPRFYDTTFVIPAVFPFALKTYMVWDTSGCGYPMTPFITDSLFLTASQIVGIDEDRGGSNTLKIYPNPAKNSINFVTTPDPSRGGEQAPSPIKTLEITDILGKKVLSANSFPQQDGQGVIDVSTLERGIYFIKIINQKNELYVGKFVKE